MIETMTGALIGALIGTMLGAMTGAMRVLASSARFAAADFPPAR
jgi:hypothetical protein